MLWVADTVQSGDLVVVESGRRLSTSQINSGGIAYVLSGGSVTNETISGGALEVLNGGKANGLMTFAASAGGTLRLDASQTFSGPGFGEPDFLDLSDIAFGSGTTVSFTEAGNNLSGTRKVSDGTHSATILLLGQYTAAQFTKQSDGHGGTLIGDPSLTTVASGTTTSVTFGGPHGWIAAGRRSWRSICPVVLFCRL